MCYKYFLVKVPVSYNRVLTVSSVNVSNAALLCNKQELLTTGFKQSLEFLKKYGNLQTSFPDLEKV